MLGVAPKNANRSRHRGARGLGRLTDEQCWRAASGRAFAAVSFGHLPVECPFNKVYGSQSPPQVGCETARSLLSSAVAGLPTSRSNATHRFFDGAQHFLYCNFTVGSRHSAVFFSSADEVITLPR